MIQRPGTTWWQRDPRAGSRPVSLLVGALAAVAWVLGLPWSNPAAASDGLNLSELLGRPVTGLSQQLAITGTPQRSEQDVVLTGKLVGVPDPKTPPRAFVAGPNGELGVFTADAQITGAADAPPRTAVLLVDTSGSMGPQGAQAAARAAQVYADTVGPTVKVGLVGFADRPTVLTAPTTDRTALAAGITKITSLGETALYDGIVEAVKQAGPGGNIVLLSDGGDTVSTAKLDQAVAAISAGTVRVDVVAFKTPESSPEPLVKIATAGKGRVVAAADAAQLGRAFAAAAAAVPLDVTVTVRTPATRTGSERVTLALIVGGKVYVGEVDLPAAPVVVQALPPLDVERVVSVAPWWQSPWLIAGVSAVLALVLTALLWPRDPAAEERRRRQRALGAYQPTGPSSPYVSVEEASVNAAAAGVLQASERLIGERQGPIALRLDRAGITLLAHEWVVLRSCIVLGVAAVGFLLGSPRWAGLLVAAVLGWLATEVWLRWRQSRRCRAFAEQLPDTLQVVASSLRSGFSLPQALAAAQEGGVQPMATELGRSLAAARIGVELEDELDRVATRMRSEDWRLAVMAIRIQRAVGGSLADVLATTATTLRARAAVTRQVHALSAEGRLSAYILLALPIGVGGFLLMFRPEYVQPLWTTTPGLVMLAAAAVGMAVGTWWMLEVATVEV